MEIILLFFLIISVILNVYLFIRGFNLVKENEKIEDFSNSLIIQRNETYEVLLTMLEEMKSIDLNGSFESDDEVGVVFNELKNLIDKYTSQF